MFDDTTPVSLNASKQWSTSRNYAGQGVPPEYNLKLVTAPVYLFWGENDLLTTPEVYKTRFQNGWKPKWYLAIFFSFKRMSLGWLRNCQTSKLPSVSTTHTLTTGTFSGQWTSTSFSTIAYSLCCPHLTTRYLVIMLCRYQIRPGLSEANKQIASGQHFLWSNWLPTKNQLTHRSNNTQKQSFHSL